MFYCTQSILLHQSSWLLAIPMDDSWFGMSLVYFYHQNQNLADNLDRLKGRDTIFEVEFKNYQRRGGNLQPPMESNLVKLLIHFLLTTKD